MSINTQYLPKIIGIIKFENIESTQEEQHIHAREIIS